MGISSISDLLRSSAAALPKEKEGLFLEHVLNPSFMNFMAWIDFNKCSALIDINPDLTA